MNFLYLPLLACLFSCNENNPPPLSSPLSFEFSSYEMKFIAHAGGGIDGITYTNSLESIMKSIEDGKRLIEIDLIETSDGHLVGAHHWEHFKEIAGFPSSEINNSPLNLKQFKATKILGKYTPITLMEASDLFDKNKELILVTDKSNNFNLIKKQYKHHDRLIVEVFGKENYREAIRTGGFTPAFSTHLITKDEYNFITKNRIKLIVTSTASLRGKELEMIKRLRKRSVEILAYTTNEDNFIAEHINNVSAFYTDFWSIKEKKCLAETPQCGTQF
jgi:glycerophosphoryl diester phosphodiesterase